MIRWAELNVILANMPLGVGLLVDKETLINYQLVISYRLLIIEGILRILTNQPTVDTTIVLSTNC
jgi:hypothetical protein